MKTPTQHVILWTLGGLLAGSGTFLLAGCSNVTNARPPQTLSATTQAQAPGEPGGGQPVFDTDAELVTALIDAAKAQDRDKVRNLLGPAWKELISGDPVADATAFKEFADRAAEKMRVEKPDESTAVLHVGKDDWEFPIPLTRTAGGKWFLNTEAGKQELLARRIGKNELEAIQICRLYVRAQREYASQDHDGSGVMKYAQKVLSTPGKRDGLYWSASPADQEQSPLASLIAKEKLEGYQPTPGQHTPYHGYRYRVLKRQGSSAPGGKYDYVINGNMVAGFALVAFPVKYEASGIMTFIVNSNGKVYQKDLGRNTTELARHMTEYNADSGWTVVEE
jgi:hypothetical protein